MKSIIQNALYQGLQKLNLTHKLPLGPIALQIEQSRNPQHGDFSSNIALHLAKAIQQSPQDLAQKIKDTLLDNTDNASNFFAKIEIAGPGFINFFLSPSAWTPILSEILNQKDQYGRSHIGENKKILVEFVSSNPTGPLHVGHGRAAVHGDVLVRLLKTIGYQVHAEYYVNDAGRQMDIVTCSIWLRYLEQGGEILSFPSHGYQGDYIQVIAKQLRIKYGTQFHPLGEEEKIGQIIAHSEALHFEDQDKHIDALIHHAKLCLGKEKYRLVNEFSLHAILEDMQTDLSEFNVIFDEWFSERSLFTSGDVEAMIDTLTHNGYTYSSAGSLWFHSTQFGDDKDRVLIRANGQATYFAADAAYRLNILKQRKFDQMINVLGADHHGYVPRIRAVIQALGYDPNQTLKVSFIQFVALYRGQEKLSMSTRKGSFVTLRELRNEVGHDATRLFYIMRKSEQHLNFDLALAKSQSQENPVYYLQYAYARMCSIIRQLEAKGLSWEIQEGLEYVSHLVLPEEISLIKQISRYPESIIQASAQCEPQLLTQYLRELAQSFHSYYNQVPLLTKELPIRNARVTLMQAVKQVFENGFHLLGVSMPNIM